VPYASYFPDFLTPSGERQDHALEDGIDRVLATPRRQLNHEIGLVAADGRRPFAGPALARGEREVLLLLGGLLRVYHEAFIAPVWDAMETAVRADVSRRSQALLTDGIKGLMNTFRPMARWQSPVLEADYPLDRDMYLEGRGLLLIPSYFCWRRPITLFDCALQPVLVYPVEKSAPLVSAVGQAELSKLLGSTRAALLQEAATHAWSTTSRLATHVGISLPSASQQLAVLREAGLLSSHRDGKHVLHAATPLGRRLLGGRFG
jgi:DNA-binding transcriptional ArsR family regulator